MGVLFEYMGLEEGEDEGVLKRRVKALRNSRGHSKLRKGVGFMVSEGAVIEKGANSEAEGGWRRGVIIIKIIYQIC